MTVFTKVLIVPRSTHICRVILLYFGVISFLERICVVVVVVIVWVVYGTALALKQVGR